jgi:hypothetical protein
MKMEQVVQGMVMTMHYGKLLSYAEGRKRYTATHIVPEKQQDFRFLHISNRIPISLGCALGKATHILQVEVLSWKVKLAPLSSESCASPGHLRGEA